MTVDDKTLIALIPQVFDRIAWLEQAVVTLMGFIKGHDQEIDDLRTDYETQFTGLVSWVDKKKQKAKQDDPF